MSESFSSVEQCLDSLSDRKATLFAAVLSERMLHNFRLYDELTEGEDRHRVDSVMALVWESLLTSGAKINFSLQQEKIAAIEDHLEHQFETSESDLSFGWRMASEAILSLSICLESLIGNRPGAAVEISRLSRDGVETFIDLTEGAVDEGSSVKLTEHPLFLEELDFQTEVIDRLSGKLEKADIRELKHLAYNEGVSNIGLETIRHE